jgi:hypothetical protein
MNVGGEVGRAAASVLWTEFELGSEKRRQRYLDLDFNTADATAILSPGVPYHVVAPGAPDDDEAAD